MKIDFVKIIIIACIASLYGCNHKEADIFDKPGSIRFEESKKEYINAFENSEHGWLMQYYPSPSRAIGGYNYFLKFKDGKVSAVLDLAGENMEQTSDYIIANRGGSVLSFNTFNSLLHAFAIPSGEKPAGEEGDFEFLILNKAKDTISLKGLRSGNYMKLIKLNEPWEGYYKKVSEIEKFLREDNYYFEVEKDSTVQLYFDKYMRSLTAKFLKKGKESSNSITYIVTDKGISFYDTLKLFSNNIKTIKVNTEDKTLAIKGDEYIKLNPLTVGYNISERWKIKIDKGVSDSFKAIFSNIKDENTKKYEESLRPIIELGSIRGSLGIHFFSNTVENKTYRSTYEVNIGLLLGKEMLNHVDISGKGEGFNWKWYKHLNPLVSEIIGKSPYILEIDNQEQPTSVKYVSVNDNNFYFTLYK